MSITYVLSDLQGHALRQIYLYVGNADGTAAFQEQRALAEGLAKELLRTPGYIGGGNVEFKVQQLPNPNGASATPGVAEITAAQATAPQITEDQAAGSLAAELGLTDEKIGDPTGAGYDRKQFALQADRFIEAEIPDAAADAGELVILGAELMPGGATAGMLARMHDDPHYASQLTVGMVLMTIAGDAASLGKVQEAAGVVKKFFTAKKARQVELNAQRAESALARAEADAAAVAAEQAEVTAQKALTELQGAIPNGHFLTKHSPMVTLDDLRRRANVGLPNRAGRLVKNDASRFISYVDMQNAVPKATAAYKAAGGTENKIEINMLKIIGEGYIKNSTVLTTTTKVVAVFNKFGQLITIYPKLR